MKLIPLFFIRVYQLFFSTLVVILFGRGCRFTPTCSEYSREAFERFGAKKGTLLTLRRVVQCHPWGKHGYDPVPDSL